MAVSQDGVYCFPWPDTGQISSVQWADCAALGKTSVAMSLDKYGEYVAAAEAASAPSSPSSEFYADSTALFGLGLAAIVTVWALKNTLLKLFFAS